MAWLTVQDLWDHVPLDVYDANGLCVLRKITGFDPVTGEVESFVADREGRYVEEAEGEIKRRRERYAAPLLWKSISSGLGRHYWDLDGR